MLHVRRRPRRSKSAGFTLVELMTVVAITGILATIGIVLVRGHVNAAKATRAVVGIQAIRVAEEAFRAQGGVYLDCSLGDPKWYPALTPGKTVYDWRQPSHLDWPRWQVLGVPRTSPTQYGYLVNAGGPGGTYPVLQTTNDPTLPTPARDVWYVIQVLGDLDGDGTFMRGVAASYDGEVYIENEAE